MCSKKDANGKFYIDEKTIANVIELTKYLMEKYDIPSENVIRHYDVTGKICPRPFVENLEDWKQFKDRLEEEMVKNIQIKLNGKIKTVEAINKNGFNFVKLRDIADDKINVGYDNT